MILSLTELPHESGGCWSQASAVALSVFTTFRMVRTRDFPLSQPSKRMQWQAPGFSLVELMVVIAVVAVVVGMTVGVSGSLNSNRGLAAIHQVISIVDSARSQALRGEGRVGLAFSTHSSAATGEVYRSVLICRENLQTEREDDWMAVSEWFYLPQGFVFSTVQPASAAAGVNLLDGFHEELSVVVPGAMTEVRLPGLVFGPLGEVVAPGSVGAASDSILLAVAEGVVDGALPAKSNGAIHTPEECRWLAIRRSSGASVILP